MAAATGAGRGSVLGGQQHTGGGASSGHAHEVSRSRGSGPRLDKDDGTLLLPCISCAELFTGLQELEVIRAELENPAVQFPDYYLKARPPNSKTLDTQYLG